MLSYDNFFYISLNTFSRYQRGRIVRHGNSEMDCGIEITSVEDADNGQWKCTVSTLSETGDFVSGTGLVNVTVGVAPETLLLRVDGTESTGENVIVKLGNDPNGAGVQMDVDCVAVQARPRPEFKWFIGSTEIQVIIWL